MLQNCVIPLQVGGCACGCYSGCRCYQTVRTKCGSCPSCGAPIYELSRVTYYWQQWQGSLYCPKPEIEYTCSCRFQHCHPVPTCVEIPLKIVVELPQPRKLAKKRSSKEW